jgi:hypothetical protein
MENKYTKHSALDNTFRAIRSGKTNIYTTVANEVAEEIGIPKNPTTKGHNDGQDGFRHAYISALTAYRYGYFASKELGNINEAKNNLPWMAANPPLEEWMDQANNKIGRDIALAVQDRGGNEEDLKREIKAAYANGILIHTPYDPRRTYREHGDWGRAIQESQEKLKQNYENEIKRVRDNGELTPEVQARIDKLFQEYQHELEKTIEKQAPSTSPSKPADIRVGSSHDPASTTVTNSSGGGEVFVHSYSRRSGDVKSHIRSSPDGNTGNNFGARGGTLKSGSSAGIREPGPNEKRIPGAIYPKK